MKIGQITWVAFPNFGTSLQAYALQRVLRSLGHEPEIADDTRFTWLAPTLSNRWTMLKGLVRHPAKGWRRLTMARPFRRFARRHLAVNRSWKTTGDLAQAYDAFVCGSDQIWSPLLPDHFGGFYFASFAGGKRRVAYAPSLGSKSAPEGYCERVSPWLKGFTALSAREEAGAEILRQITGRGDIPTLIDPTLLLDGQEWRQLVSNEKPTKPYVLAYLLTPNDAYLRHARKIAGEKGMELRTIDAQCRYSALGAIGPQEFVTAIANAAYVVTDSFHGTIFSIHFRRPFTTVKRFADNTPNSQNSRIENLFSTLGITGNFTDATSLDRTPPVPDWEDVTKRLDAQRRRSLDYLKSSLS